MATGSDYVIGVDESGKGDFFGPLVVAAAAVGPLEMPLLDELYVRDSKKLTDKRAVAVAARLRAEIPYNVVTIMPAKYNELYQQIGNLNHLLSWGHARAIENLLSEVECDKVISDKFAAENVLQSSLMGKGKQVELVQQVRGERNPSVAAASILARAEFLNRLEYLGRKFKMTLPKGAASAVDQAGRRFVEEYNEEKLGEVCKLHFKNLRKIGDLIGRVL